MSLDLNPDFLPSESTASFLNKLVGGASNSVNKSALDILSGWAPTATETALGSLLGRTREAALAQESQSQLASLREKIREQASELENTKNDRKKSEAEKTKLEKLLAELDRAESMRHVLLSVHESAHDRLKGDPDFRAQFTDSREISAFVVSIDIRRSTELMLKARKPSGFAAFITTLCGDLERIVKSNYGVFDKFTGDGILAFFPEFFAGPDAGFYALKAAKEANQAFANRYREFWSSFSTVLMDVGLGVGIDFGTVQLVRMAGSLTVVGQPVVYACRFGGAPAGSIFLNQPAFEQVGEKYAHLVAFDLTSLEIKSEGRLICYSATLGDRHYPAELPPWRAADIAARETAKKSQSIDSTSLGQENREARPAGKASAKKEGAP